MRFISISSEKKSTKTNGLQTLISRRAGENRPEEIGKIFGQGVFISLIIALIGILLTWFVAPLILNNTLQSKEIANDSVHYLRLRIWGLPFLYIYQMRNALLVGTNNSRYLISGTLAETIANVLFDYLLIFGKWGFPEMGLNGAAIASIIAEFTGLFIIYLIIHRKGITKKFGLFAHFKWNADIAKSILNISLPLVFQLAISLISWEFFYILIEHHGQTALAISNIMRNIFGLIGCVTWALAATTSSMVSNIIGQGKQQEVMGLIWRIVRISTGLSLIIAILINIFPEALLSIYGQDDAFIQEAVPVARVVTVAMMMMSISVIWMNAVTGTGNSRISFLIELITIILYCIYVYLVVGKYFLPMTYGWMSEWLYWICILLLALWYMQSGKWKGKAI